MRLRICPTSCGTTTAAWGTDGTPIDHLTGGAMGQGLFQKIQDNYGYLSYVRDPGDDVYLFGFSRGAYTARSVGGMIAGFGVPTKNFDNAMVGKIFAAYRETDQGKRAALKADLTTQYGLTDVSVKMIGVWDTVGSLGIPGVLFSLFDQKQYGFLDTTLHPNVQKAYHAVCIDERRAQFMPTLWNNADGSPRPNDAQVTQGVVFGCALRCRRELCGVAAVGYCDALDDEECDGVRVDVQRCGDGAVPGSGCV